MTTQTATLDIRSESCLIISLGELRIFCEYTKSDNGQYTLAFCDGDPFKHIGGHRQEGKGFYFLIANNVFAVMGQIERPNDGKVANNGWFIINDWLFTDNPESVAYCFDNKGDIVIQKKLKANLLANAISKNGSFALFQTANSDNDYGNNLLFYDLKTQQLLWKKKCDFAWPKKYSILEDERKINLHFTDIGTVSLDWEGNIIDRQEYQLKYVSSLSGNRLVYESIGLLSGTITNQTLINLLEKGVNDNNTSPNTKAVGYKFLGELFETENLQKAYAYFEKALECNPKIGLKRKLLALKDKL
jgi:tetratricopeptide (TPR) repeat protein